MYGLKSENHDAILKWHISWLGNASLQLQNVKNLKTPENERKIYSI